MTEFHFHIGPVQGFIAEARRTRDYWAGSFILSRLSAEAMKAAMDQGANIISPKVWDAREKTNSDPMLWAVVEPGEGPFLGTLGNHFSATVPKKFDGEKCACAVRRKWKEIADAVWCFVFEHGFAWQDDAEKMRVRGIWDNQIGNENISPFWEIYWVRSNEQNDDWLARRKMCRISQDVAPSPAFLRQGNYCTMIQGWQEISGLTRHNARQQQDDFWARVRERLVYLRYERNWPAEHCLDLRANERLCAPAFVKRVFPLLSEDTLKQVIGWKPEIRGIIAEWTPKQQTLLKKIKNFFTHSPPEGEIEINDIEHEFTRQSLTHWPSTSYMAAANWIARVQRSAPKDLGEKFFTAAINFSWKHAVAEKKLWLRSVKETASDENALWHLDGSLFFDASLEAIGKELEKKTPDELLKLLKKIKNTQIQIPLDIARVYSDNKIGPPSPYYAILRMDGDHMGQALAGKNAKQILQGLNDFNLALRGNPNATKRRDRAGIVVAQNGVTMFAGGDDLLAMFPIEDVIPAALAVREKFASCFQGIGQPPTISGAITIAHRQAPLRWVLTENERLLNQVAKKAQGRNALAFNLLLPSTQGFEWAAPWQTSDNVALIEKLNGVIEDTVKKWPHLSSNQFYHLFRDRMAPYLEKDERAPHAERVISTQDPLHNQIGNAESLLLALLISGEQQGTLPNAEFSESLIQLCRCYDQEGKATDNYLTAAPLKIVRVITRYWCKDVDAYDDTIWQNPNGRQAGDAG